MPGEDRAPKARLVPFALCAQTGSEFYAEQGAKRGIHLLYDEARQPYSYV
jgi:hypothetical protein